MGSLSVSSIAPPADLVKSQALNAELVAFAAELGGVAVPATFPASRGSPSGGRVAPVAGVALGNDAISVRNGSVKDVCDRLGGAGYGVLGPFGFSIRNKLMSDSVPPDGARRVKGKIVEFNRGMQRRFQDLISTFDMSAALGVRKGAARGNWLFGSLTLSGLYKGDYATDRVRLDAAFRCLYQRMRRKWGDGVQVVWRKDLQHRGAIHWHLLMHFDAEQSVRYVKAWLRDAWHELVGDGQAAHLVYGVDVRACYGGGSRLMGYISGYLSKIAAASSSIVGRSWGVWGKKYLPRDYGVGFVVLDRPSYVELMRRLRRWGKGKNRYATRASLQWRGMRIWGGYSLGQLLEGLNVLWVDLKCP